MTDTKRLFESLGDSTSSPKRSTALRAERSDPTEGLWEVIDASIGKQRKTDAAAIGEAFRRLEECFDKVCADPAALPQNRKLRHSGKLLHAAWAGSRVVTASTDRFLRVFDDTDAPRTLRHGGTVNYVDMSADGALLATACSDKTVRIIDVAELEVRLELSHAAPVEIVRWSPLGDDSASSCAEPGLPRWVGYSVSASPLGSRLGRRILQNLVPCPRPVEEVASQGQVQLGRAERD